MSNINGLPPYWMPFPALRARNNDNSRNDNTRSSNKCTIDYVICALGISLLIVVIYGILLPGPQPDNPMLEFQVNSLEVTSMKEYNVSNDYYSIVRNVMADLDFNVTLKAKDEISMYYNPMQVSLEYQRDEFLSSTVLEPFLLLGDHRHLQFGMQINDVQNKTVDSIWQDLWGRKQNILQFALKAQGHFLRWRGYLQKCGITVVCDDIKVRFLPASNWTIGSMIGSPLICKCKSDCPKVIVIFNSTAG